MKAHCFWAKARFDQTLDLHGTVIKFYRVTCTVLKNTSEDSPENLLVLRLVPHPYINIYYLSFNSIVVLMKQSFRAHEIISLPVILL